MTELERASEIAQWTNKYEAMMCSLGAQPEERLKVHIRNLNEYFLRWLGFCRLETKAPHTLRDTNLYFVVEAASMAAHKDVLSLKGLEYAPIIAAWERFQESMVALRTGSLNLKSQAEASYTDFKAVEDQFNRTDDSDEKAQSRGP